MPCFDLSEDYLSRGALPGFSAGFGLMPLKHKFGRKNSDDREAK